jgi:clathrin heavy chain
VSVAIENA